MANLEYRQPDPDAELDIDPIEVDVVEPVGYSEPEELIEPEGEELDYLKELKGKPTLVNKVGLYTEEQYQKALKAANDNRSQIRPLMERISRLERQPEQRQTIVAGPTSDELWKRFDESGDPADRAAAMKAHREEITREMKVEFDGKIKEISIQTTAAQFQKQLNEVLSRPENRDLSSEILTEYFVENATSNPEEDVFIYRARQHKGGLRGYIQDYARSLARQPQGAPTAPAGGGTRRQQYPANNGRRLSKQEALDDFHGRRG